MKVSTGETTTNYNFLKGGGESAELIASVNWSQTSLGPIEWWPQSLRTTLDIILHSKFPMFLFWGPELICFYNDGYRPSLGKEGKHPSAMGRRGKDVWPEIWHIIKPLIDKVLTGGEATWNEDQLIPIYRNGKLEDVYWTFSYSPVHDESGSVAGVFVTCTETTEKINLLARFEQNEKKFLDMIEQAPMGIAILTGPAFIVAAANATYLNIVDRKAEQFINKPLFEVLPEAESALRPYLVKVFQTGESYYGNELPVQLNRYGQTATAFFNFTYQPLFEGPAVKGVIVTANDITKLVEARMKITDAEERVRIAVEAGELGTFDLNMLTGEIYCSPRFYEIFGSKEPISREEGINRILPEDLPIREKAMAAGLKDGRLKYEVRIKWLDGSIHWMRMDARFFFDETGKPVRLMGTSQDITDEKEALQKIEESEKHFRSLIQESPVPKALLRGPDYILEIANDAMLELWDKSDDVIEQPLRKALPELQHQPYLQILDEVYNTGISYKGNERPAYIEIKGEHKKIYLNLIFKRLRSYSKEGHDILVTGYEVTQQVLARKNIEYSEKELQKINQRLEIALEAGRLGSYELDLATGMLNCTPQCKANYGFSANAVFNLPDLLNTIVPQHKDFIQPGINKAIQERKVYNNEHCITWPDGSLHWIRLSGKATYDEEGNPEKMVGVTLDITATKLAIQRIADSEQRLNMALEYTNTGSWDLNLRTFEIIYTPRLAEIFGYLPTAKITHPQMRRHIHPEDLKPIVEKAFSNAIKTGIYYYEARLIRPDNSIRWIRTQGRVMYDADKIPIRMLGTIMDITEEKNEQQRKDEFMGIVTHELKTPLTSVKGFAQFLHERAVTAEDRTSAVLLEKMVAQVNKLNLLVQDLLDITRMEGGKMKFQNALFNFNELVHEVAEQISITTTKKIIIEDAVWSGSIIGDRERTGQVLTNLLTNAIKYSPGADKVIIAVDATKDRVICSVTDFGIGIAKENQPFVFDRFYREAEAHASTFPGLGLGLYISAEIIKRQDGKIWMQSEKGKGSVFSFSLPLNT